MHHQHVVEMRKRHDIVYQEYWHGLLPPVIKNLLGGIWHPSNIHIHFAICNVLVSLVISFVISDSSSDVVESSLQ